MARFNIKGVRSEKIREKLSNIGLGKESQEFSSPLATDLRKLNKNKFFYNLEGNQKPGSQN